MKIYKYGLSFSPKQTLLIPLVKILRVEYQRQKPCLWALIDESLPKIYVDIYNFMTGEDAPEEFDSSCEYVSSTMSIDGYNFVSHWFYKSRENLK